VTDEQSERVITYYQRDAANYDKQYDVPFFKEIYDKMTWRYIEPYLPQDGVVLVYSNCQERFEGGAF